MTGSRVVALGHYQPERVLTNAELATMVETNDEWIQSRVGIRERRIAAPDEQVDEMAWRAADKAIANAGIDSSEIDYVVVATCTAIDRSPNMAATMLAQSAGIDRATDELGGEKRVPPLVAPHDQPAGQLARRVGPVGCQHGRGGHVSRGLAGDPYDIVAELAGGRPRHRATRRENRTAACPTA